MELICLDIVPDATKPWNPLMAPQAIVTKRNGKIGGAPPPLSLIIGALVISIREKGRTIADNPRVIYR